MSAGDIYFIPTSVTFSTKPMFRCLLVQLALMCALNLLYNEYSSAMVNIPLDYH